MGIVSIGSQSQIYWVGKEGFTENALNKDLKEVRGQVTQKSQ